MGTFLARLGSAAAGCVLVAGVAVWLTRVETARTERRDDPKPERTESEDPRPMRAYAGGNGSEPRENAGVGDPHYASLAGPEAGETTLGWNDVPPARRLDQLESAFSEAVAAARKGDARAVDRAGDALSALRPELYATDEGRTRHAELEQTLDALAEER